MEWDCDGEGFFTDFRVSSEVSNRFPPDFDFSRDVCWHNSASLRNVSLNLIPVCSGKVTKIVILKIFKKHCLNNSSKFDT